MQHLIMDFETFGADSLDCAAIDVSVMTFNTEKMLSDKPYTCKDITETTKFKLSVKDQVSNYGFIVYEDTLKFWQGLPEDARKHILPKKSDLLVKDFVDQFLSYLTDKGKIDYWWTRGNTFDPIILTRLFKSQGKRHIMNEYLKFWKVEDTRTFINAKLEFPAQNGFVPIIDEEFWNKVFVAHDSSWDILADVLRIQTILRLENDLEQTKR